MKTRYRERIALVCAVSILAAAAWFWSEQIRDVLELLEMAYG